MAPNMPPPRIPMQLFGHRLPLEVLATELLYFLIVAGICIYIYAKTKDYYDLTKHKGIHFFRNTFLYFSFSYLFRIVFVVLRMVQDGHSPMFPIINIVFVSYFSTLAIMSLSATVFARNIRLSALKADLILHGIALVASIITLVTGSHEILIAVQTLLFAAALGSAFVIKKPKHSALNRVVYLLLFAAWIINIIAFTRFFLVPMPFRIALYVFSIAIFVLILARVVRSPHAKKKR